MRGTRQNVDRHLQLYDVTDPAVVQAMRAVPRERFVPPDLQDEAYADRALPIDCGQTISQPAVVAYMTEQLRLTPESRVLEVGTGSGYQAAVLARIVHAVYTIERIPALARTAAARLAALGCQNVQVRVGDGADGWPSAAPFDGIIVTAVGDRIPPALLQQLGPGGRLIMPVGTVHGEQVLLLLERGREGTLAQRELWPVRFVPLLSGVAAESEPAP
jgi:protein-L-isoaspartate(D-aspartate) O-methyltransferase